MTNSAVIAISSELHKNRHIYNQVYATIASCCLAMVGGIPFGYTAVLLPQLKEDSGYPYDAVYDSWIASICPLAMMFGSIISGPLSDILGRKLSQILLSIPIPFGWLIMGLASDNTAMLTGRFITGFCSGAARPVCMIYVGEITDPKHRPVSLVNRSLAVYFGIILSHTVGKFLPWRMSCFIFILPNILCLVMLLFLIESPLWLISRGKIQKGTAAFKVLRGDGEAAQNELKSILEKQDEKKYIPTLQDIRNIVFSKAFFNSLKIIFLMFVAVQFCGVATINFYAQDMFKATFSGEVDEYMMMIVTDVIGAIAVAVMAVFSSRIPRRISFLGSCFGTVLVLLLLVVYLIIKPQGLLWIPISCFVVYLSISSAMVAIAWSYTAEIFPNNARGLGSSFCSVLSFALMFVSVKVTPSVLANYGNAAMYGGFALITLISGIFLAFLLPETNGRSLQDIENNMYNKNKAEKQQRSSESQE